MSGEREDEIADPLFGARLALARRHLDHLLELRPRVGSAAALDADLDRHNNVWFSLLRLTQAISDLAAGASSLPPDVMDAAERARAFRDALLRAPAELPPERALAALDDLEPLDRFLRIVADGIVEAEREG